MANFAFFLGASNENLEAVKSADPSKIAGVKIFMGSSTGNMLVDEEAVLEQIFRHAPTTIATHCEDTPTILRNEEVAKKKYYNDAPLGTSQYTIAGSLPKILHPRHRTGKAGKCPTSCAPYFHGGGTRLIYPRRSADYRGGLCAPLMV